MTIAKLLTAVERWQHHMQTAYSPEAFMEFLGLRAEVETMNIPALKRAAHQHAEALRKEARIAERMPVMVKSDAMRAAADFMDGTDA